MRLSSREILLSWSVGLLILLGLSYWFCAPKVRIWMENASNRKQMAESAALQEKIIQTREQWAGRQAALMTKLAKYAADQDVTADYLKIMERVAKDSNLSLTRRQPQKEKRHGEMYELAIDCSWEGNLEGLIRFLFALEQEKNAMDIEDLTVSLQPGGKGQMKGNFTINCVYARSGQPPPGPKEKNNARPDKT
jgi:hypothetical protein